jgi:hypothetical protein
MIFIANRDRVVRWFDPEAIELSANSLTQFVLRPEERIDFSEVGGIQSVVI